MRQLCSRLLHNCRGGIGLAGQARQPPVVCQAGVRLLLCRSRNKVVAEYALHGSTRPMGVAEDQLIESLPAVLPTGLPGIEQIERELAESFRTDEDGSDAN